MSEYNNRIQKAVKEIHLMDDFAGQKGFLQEIHPLAKVVVTVSYLALVASVGRYDLWKLLSMGLYPVCIMIVGEISVVQAFRRLRFVILSVFLLGIVNPLLDRAIIYDDNVIFITGGMVSMFTLFGKGIFSVIASYVLMASTSMEGICYALRLLGIPKILVTVIMLVYRYTVLMLKEAERMTESYHLRAPGQKGIYFRAWGSFGGQMLLRSMERAQKVYESMLLRGFQGDFYLSEKFCIKRSVCFALFFCIFLIILRWLPIFEMAGKLL